MFSTTGLFKDISCPFFLVGLCERPYCHFKHSRHEEAKARKEAEKASLAKADVEDDEYKPPTSSLQRTLQEIENSIQTEKRKLGGSHDDNERKEVKRTKDKVCIQNKPTGTPEYNPTPLCDLKKQKIKEKLGKSKYDLALLDEPAEDGEYDPASNFSTGIKHASSNKSAENSYKELPDYANVLQGVKRPADGDGDDEHSPLAKIPKFVSVEYTPTVNDSVEYSDDEATDIKDSFSEDESDNASDSERLLKQNSISEKQNKSKENKKDSENVKSKEESLLPIEFTAEGFVKSVYVEQSEASKAKKESTKKGKSNSGKKQTGGSKAKTRKDINIFALFEDEFDSALDKCDSETKTNITESQPNVKLKPTSTSSKHLHPSENENNKSSAHTETKHKSKSNHKDDKHSSSKSHDKLSSSSHKSKTKSSSSRSDRDSDVSQKHKESNSTSKHKSSKDSSSKDSSSKNKDRTDKSSSSLSRLGASSKSDHKSSKNSDHNKTSHSNHSISNGKYSHSSSKHKDHSDRHSSSNSKSGRHKSDKSKKHILNLDVDLFSNADNDVEANHHDYEDDMSDIEKYFLDEDPFDECLRIFNEDNTDAPSTSTASDKKKHKKTSEQESAPAAAVGKKRVALKQSSSDEKKRKVVSDKPVPRPSPAQVMMNRFKKMQEQALKAEQDEKEKLKQKVRKISKQNAERASTSTAPSKPNLSSASSTFTTYMANKNKKTTAITVTKGAKRKAHTPTVPIAKLKRPTVEISTSSKVPSNVRQRYLNLFIDECIKIYPTEEEAFKKGKEEEEAVFKRCASKQIYLNFSVNTIKRLRTTADQKKSSGSKSSSPVKKLSHASMLDGAGATKHTYTLHRSGGAVKVPEEDYTGAALYKRLQPYVLSEEQLKLNNFPHPDPDKGGTAVFHGEQKKDKRGSTKGYEKLCIRCGKIFEVYPNGKYPIKEECVYHWGKAWKKKIAGSIETRYTCCQGDLASEGCQVAKLHVHETNKTEPMTGFMKTIPSSPPLDGDYGVYALDCEMVYTTMGVELARVTVVGADEEPAYESLVRPDNRVVDCNTRFSGITDEDLEDVQTSLRDVQAVLLSLFTDKTILIGHSLESDLTALKLFHFTVVDTSVVFPHRMGYPFKRALKNLMSEYLKKIIQDDVGGHDSLEDALACIQLMQYRLKEDAKREVRGRRLSS